MFQYYNITTSYAHETILFCCLLGLCVCKRPLLTIAQVENQAKNELVSIIGMCDAPLYQVKYSSPPPSRSCSLIGIRYAQS